MRGPMREAAGFHRRCNRNRLSKACCHDEPEGEQSERELVRLEVLHANILVSDIRAARDLASLLTLNQTPVRSPIQQSGLGTSAWSPEGRMQPLIRTISLVALLDSVENSNLWKVSCVYIHWFHPRHHRLAQARYDQHRESNSTSSGMAQVLLQSGTHIWIDLSNGS
jgi:hypothetical protein